MQQRDRMQCGEYKNDFQGIHLCGKEYEAHGKKSASVGQDDVLFLTEALILSLNQRLQCEYKNVYKQGMQHNNVIFHAY